MDSCNAARASIRRASASTTRTTTYRSPGGCWAFPATSATIRSPIARAELGFDGFSEFWFQNVAETSRIGEIMETKIGAQLLEDEPRFMNVHRNQTYGVSERLHGTRPEPGKEVRALAITRLPAGAQPGPPERELDSDETRIRERALPGVIAALHIMPEGASMPLPPDMPGMGCVESLWLASREALDACNRWRAAEGAALLWVVDESGTPVLSWPRPERQGE